MKATFARLILIGSLLGVIILLACNKWDFDKASFTNVITVGALEVGFNSAFLLGDIDGLRNANIIETGFLLSSNTSNDESMQLGSSGVIPVTSPQTDSVITEDRAFAARAIDLDPSTKYFFRAYIKLEGDENAYGSIDTFTTSSLTISLPTVTRTFEGCSGNAEVVVNIEGARLSPDQTFGFVWSTNESNSFPTLESGNVLSGIEPDQSGNVLTNLQVNCGTSYYIRGFVSIKDQTSYGMLYAFTTKPGGDWIPRSIYPGSLRTGAMLYSDDVKGYLSGGDQALSHGEIWAFDDEFDSWNLDLISDKLRLHNGIGVSYNGTHYFLTGRTPYSDCGKREVCSSCNSCSCVEVEILPPWNTDPGGRACDCYLDSILVFGPQEQHSRLNQSVPLPKMKGATSIRINNLLILGGGESIIDLLESRNTAGKYGPDCLVPFGDVGVQRQCLPNMVALDLNTTLFTELDPIPGESRFRLVGFSIADQAFAGLGIKCTHDTRTAEALNDFYKLELNQPNGQQWTSLTPIPSMLEARTSFALGNKGYVLTSDNTNNTSELWQFDPVVGQGEWRVMKDPPANWLSTIGSFVIGNRAFIYFTGITDNFWMYIPELD